MFHRSPTRESAPDASTLFRNGSWRHVLVAVVLAVIASPLFAEVPVPIKDIYARTGGGSISLGAELDGFVYYGACKDEDFFGCELYRTPIGGSGAELVKDIVPGSGSSNPTDLVVADGTLFFRANSNQLWMSDGTEEGTSFVRGFSQIRSGPGYEWAVLGDKVVFSAEDSSANGRELWVSDGTGTFIFDICPGSCDGNPNSMTTAGNRVFFVAYDGGDVELRKYESGAVSQVGDINPSGHSSPGDLAALGSDVVFFASDATEFGLWLSDGTTNTKLAGSAESLYGAGEMVSTSGGLAYFDGYDGNQVTGRELWVTNGTPGGTGLIADINPGVASSNPRDLTAVGSSIFFTADDGTIGRELWIRTPTTTAPLEITPGSSGPPTLTYITDLDGVRAIFAADDGTGFGEEPWVSDGTPAGTFRIADLDPGPDGSVGAPFFTAQGQAFFPSDALDDGDELWRTDGAALTKLTEIGTGSGGGGISQMTSLNGYAYFCADDGVHGDELWRTDATTGGTILVQDLSPGEPFGCSGNEIVSLGGSLYFAGHDGTSFGLWKSNGAPGGAVFIKAFTSAPSQLTAHGGVLYFVADDGGGAGAELWKSDGTTGGTALVKDLYPGSLPANVTDLTSGGGFLYFGGRHTTTGDFELWQSDGTALGTAVLKDINPGTGGSFPDNFGEVGGTVLFTANDGTNGEEVWVTDGTEVGTTLLADIDPGGSGASGVDGFVAFGGHAYFVGDDGTNGRELWRTDGTSGNTAMFADIAPGSSGSRPQGFSVVGSHLLFSADDGTNGRELWKTDGSTTSLVRDIDPSGSSSPRVIFPTGVGDQAYFGANDGSGGGEELWATDGTTGGTVQIADLHSDGGSAPRGFAFAGTEIVFTANVGVSGRELWSFGEVDCGDAPDPTYPTLLLSGGACHHYDPATSGVMLGSLRDADPDGQPTAAADGDDIDGSDDDDGVTFTSPFVPESQATFDVVLPVAAILNVWIDWAADGDWTDSGEHVVFNRSLAAGTHALTVDVPYDAVLGETVARFRVDSVGTPFAEGVVFDGEVEDHVITVTELLDFGDAPGPYPTLLADDGARHDVVSGVHLGAGVDRESDGQPTAGADGDDTDGTDDEDGVVFTSSLVPGASASVEITASVAGSVSGWIDFDGNGIWNQVEELVVANEAVSSGTSTFFFAVPAGAQVGTTFSRFRFDTNGAATTPTGRVDDGEVEDDTVEIVTTADLAVAKSAPDSAIPGDEVVFTIVTSNGGPGGVVGATVTDNFTIELGGCTWTCSGASGGACAASGAGDIAESVDLPVGGSVTFTATCTIAPDADGDLVNTATVAPPAGMADPTPGNDSSTSTTTLVPTADLSIEKGDGQSVVVPPATLTYTILVGNPGPSEMLDARVQDPFPVELTNVQWTCSGTGGGSCSAVGSGDIDELVDLPAGATVTFTATADTVGEAGEIAVNTATVTAAVGFTDPNPDNDDSTDFTEYVTEDVLHIGRFESGTTSDWDAVVGEVEP